MGRGIFWVGEVRVDIFCGWFVIGLVDVYSGLVGWSLFLSIIHHTLTIWKEIFCIPVNIILSQRKISMQMHYFFEQKSFQCNYKEIWTEGKILEKRKINKKSQVNGSFFNISEKHWSFTQFRSFSDMVVFFPFKGSIE